MISEVYNMDCMEYMKTIPDKFFDIAIVDPPYGINAPKMSMGSGFSAGNYSSKRRLNGGAGKLRNRVLNQSNCEWDETPPGEDYFKELFRVSKNQIIWGGNYFPLPPTRCIVAWDKCQPWENFSQVEIAWTSYDKPAKLYRLMNGGANAERKIHPTQKPVALLEYLIKTYTNENETVLDFTMGSGSTGVAAVNTNRNFIGIEKDLEYFEIAKERLYQAQKDKEYSLF